LNQHGEHSPLYLREIAIVFIAQRKIFLRWTIERRQTHRPWATTTAKKNPERFFALKIALGWLGR
jgi:hypothetical protein